MQKVLVSFLVALLLTGCANRYKQWAIDQTYGQVPCLTITIDQIIDGSEYPPFLEAPLDTWVVACDGRAYHCSYRGQYGVFPGVARLGRGQTCNELRPVPPEIQKIIDEKLANKSNT